MIRAPASLRLRLILSLALATLAIGTVALLDTRAEAIRTARDVSDRVLLGSAMAIAERVTVSDDGGLDAEVPFSALEMLSSTAEDRVFYRIDGPGGFLTGYEDLARLDATPEAARFADSRMRGDPVRQVTIARSVTSGEGTLAIAVTVAETTRARDGLARAILWRSAIRLSLIGVAAMAIAWAVITLALRPLDRLGQAIAARAPGDLDPLSAPVPQEIAPLIEALNGFIGRLQSSMSALRRFTSNANHQIRTPLATARTHLALAGRAGGEGASLAKADQALVRAERVLAQLLLLARLDATEGGIARVPVDLAALAREVTAEALPRADEAGQDLGYDGPDSLMILAEPVLLAEAIGNLVDNAIAHAGRDCAVTVRVSDPGSLAVSDTGKGLPPDRLARLFLPAGAGADHGLGLSIVQDIARRLGGEVSAVHGEGERGLTVRLDLGQRL